MSRYLHRHRLEGSLGRVLKCMESTGKYFDDKDVAMKQCQDDGMRSILDLRQRINAHLDWKQDEVTQELISKCKAEKTNADMFRQKLRRLEAAVQNTTAASLAAAQRGDNVEMIQLFIRGETEIRACNDLIDEISSSKSVNIKHDIDGNLVTILHVTLPDGVQYIHYQLLCNSRVKNFRKFKINVPSDNKRHCYVHGVVLMSNGDIVISDFRNQYLKLFSPLGECLNVLKIKGYPHDVCLVDDSTVAVAVSHNKIGIHVVKVQDSVLTLSTVIKTQQRCYGITFVDGKFIVSTTKDICKIDRKSGSEKVDQLPKCCTHLVSCSNEKRIFASMFTSKQNGVVVTRLSSGKQKECVLGVGLVKGGRGIDVDREGNLYVCGHESNNVVQVSADGTQVRELLTSKDGIDRPGAISVCGNKFVVTNKRQNDLHVFQLY